MPVGDARLPAGLMRAAGARAVQDVGVAGGPLVAFGGTGRAGRTAARRTAARRAAAEAAAARIVRASGPPDQVVGFQSQLRRS
ncbi:hypothetical protein [Streptomyces sp. NPDC058457]|uniref:hypothetical protein n=1 Tax=Streptomyces sp. NPDC058457 TaxID=3346507 RepID=UPI0036530721